MTDVEYMLLQFESYFSQYEGKNIVIYGTGPNTKLILERFPNFGIVGLMDGAKRESDIFGLPLLSVDDLFSMKVDLIIVVARRANLRLIYDRLRHVCMLSQIPVYGINGKNLADIFGSQYISQEGLDYFELHERDLIKQIDAHEVISFDVFDTLMMRKTLLPTDVFDIVGDRAQRLGIAVADFKALRILAEHSNEKFDGNLNGIYLNLQEISGITDEHRNRLLQLEIEVEKQVLIRREKMVEMLAYACQAGKRVILISDMYLPRSVIEEILHGLNIKAYDDLLVSCEYGVSKSNGLFDIHKQRSPGQSYLHIGDNKQADGFSAEEAGMSTFLIRSAVEMLKLSTYSVMKKYMSTVNERSLVGLMVARIFNNPFCLHGSRGRPDIDQVRDVGYLFIGPLITSFVLWMIRELERNDYDDMLFTSRDGFLIQKLYNIAVDKLEMSNVPIGTYFIASRKLCTKASMLNDDDIRWLALCYPKSDPYKLLSSCYGVREDEMLPYDAALYADLGDYALAHKEIIYKRSTFVRTNYAKYLKRIGLREGGKYAIFDLHSGGTILYFLSQAMSNYQFEGLFVNRYRTPGNKANNVNVKSFFVHPNPYSYATYFSGHYLLLEMIITSTASSVRSMNENGEPIYEVEDRTAAQLRFLEDMHTAIEDFFNEYLSELYVKDCPISADTADMIYNLMDDAYTNEHCSTLDEIALVDDLGSRVVAFDRKQWEG